MIVYWGDALMDKLIQMRLQILEDSGEISFSVAQSVRAFIRQLESRYAFEVSEENGAMFVTHLAVALNRIQKGETIEEIDPILLTEAEGTRYWSALPGLLAELEAGAKVKIPQQERGYLALHLAVMLDKAKGGEGN